MLAKNNNLFLIYYIDYKTIKNNLNYKKRHSKFDNYHILILFKIMKYVLHN